MTDIKTLLQLDNMAADAEMASIKVSVMLEDLLNYFEDTDEDFLKFYKNRNMAKIDIAMEYVRRTEERILAIQSELGKLLEEKRSQESKCA